MSDNPRRPRNTLRTIFSFNSDDILNPSPKQKYPLGTILSLDNVEPNPLNTDTAVSNVQTKYIYVFNKEDIQKLIEGIILAGKIFLKGGAQLVMPHTFDYYEFKNEKELEQLRQIVKKPGDLTLGTGHPQGGNAVSKNKSKGVVSPEFKVYGYDNLYVCDASVFPSSLGVNPQLTVMALADYTSEFIN